MKIAIVVSRFNASITDALLTGCLTRLSELAVDTTTVPVTEVPGAVELPLVAQQYAQKGGYQAVICLGAVIRGETSHYDYVCQQASQGCQQVALAHNIPIIFGVLTTENRQQANDRIGGSHGHKGVDAADAAVEMIQVMESLNNA